MTTNDPFASPPGTPQDQPAPPPSAQPVEPAQPAQPSTPPSSPPAQPAPPPGVLAPEGPPPGMLTPPAAPYAPGVPGAPVPPPFGAAPVIRPDAPTGLATGAIVLTGLYALLGLVGALTAASQVETLKETYADPENASLDLTSSLIGVLVFAVGIGSYVVLALWMAKIRANRTALGTAPGGPPAVEWWGWFVPVAHFVLPLLGMRAITRRVVGWGLLLGWWIPFAIYWVFYWVTAVSQVTAVDYTTGELTNPDALDSLVPLSWASAVAIVISWVFLAIIVRVTTRKHLTA